MKNCKDIENSLPLYLEDLLSSEGKRAVEEHLKSCPKCVKAFAQLQETGKLMDSLGEVEPPPWFKQKIMARVREEAEKKSFAQKWFYPLRIKIPVQVFATIFIVVIAVYIYRAGNEQIKTIMPPETPVPVMESQKDQLSMKKDLPGQVAPPSKARGFEAEESCGDKSCSASQPVGYGSVNEALPQGKVVSPPQALPVQKSTAIKQDMSQENVRAGTADMARAMKGDAAVDKKETNYATLSEKQAEPAKPMPQKTVELERKKEGYTLGAVMKESRAPETQSMIPKTNISVHVRDLNTAVGDVEKLLNKYEAKKIVKQMPEGKAIFTAELKVKNIKDLIAQLKAIGRIGEKGLPANSAEGDIAVMIEITRE